ncbi:hypothetical protein C1X85_34970, partial [Pseudomonas sp. GP01-A6]|uniref:hypothetical protein n=1 Tax=Pseudomonas sp. GP01-A6 TaxID=2070569 RepID=UPI000CAE061C
VPILRLLEAGGGASALLLVGALFIPVIIGVFTGQSPYTWANLEAVKADPILLHKSKYLNPVFWTARLVIFFGVWAWVAAAFRKSTLT